MIQESERNTNTTCPREKQRKAVTGKEIMGWGVRDGALQEGNDRSPLVGKF